MISRNENLCPLCGGEKREGKTTFTADSPRQNRKVVSNDIGSRQAERNGRKGHGLSPGRRIESNDLHINTP